MQSDGYRYVTTADELNAVGKSDKLLGLFGRNGDLVQPINGNTAELLLSEMVEKSIDMLDGRTENGFILMAEGATIDHNAHSNYAEGAVDQVKLFDDAVKKALDFAKEDGNTLVIVSADHETGGLGLLESDSIAAGTPVSGKYKWTTGNHTSAYVPIYAYGPCAEKLTGVRENTDMFDAAMSALGIEKTVHDRGDEDEKLIFELNFDNEDISTDYGRAAAKGSLSYEDGHSGKAVRFTGNASNYIEMYDDNGESLLASCSSFTVSYWSETDASNNANWGFYAAPGAEKQTSGGETYVGISDYGSTITAERNLNGNKETTSAYFTRNKWKHTALVVDKDKTRLYVNGRIKSETDSDTSIADILEAEPIAYIGRANMGSGAGFDGLIDEFRVYNYCLSTSEIEALYGEEIELNYISTDSEVLQINKAVISDSEAAINVQTQRDINVFAAAAVYNNGVFSSIHTDNYTLKAGEAAEISLPYMRSDRNENIRLFLWESGTMRPLIREMTDEEIVPSVKVTWTEPENGEFTVTANGADVANGDTVRAEALEITPKRYLGYEVRDIVINGSDQGYDKNEASLLYIPDSEAVNIKVEYEKIGINGGQLVMPFNYTTYLKRFKGNGSLTANALDSTQNSPLFYLGVINDLEGVNRIGLSYASQNNGGVKASVYASDEYLSDLNVVQKNAELVMQLTTESTGSWTTYTTTYGNTLLKIEGEKHLYLYLERNGWCGNYRSMIFDYNEAEEPEPTPEITNDIKYTIDEDGNGIVSFGENPQVKRLVGSNGKITDNGVLDSTQDRPVFYLGTMDVTNLASVGYNYAASTNGGAVVSFIALDEYTDNADTVKAAIPMLQLTTENTKYWKTYTTTAAAVTNPQSGTKHIYLYMNKKGWCGNYKNIIFGFN